MNKKLTEREKTKRMKLEARAIGRIPEKKKKKGPTGELELFKGIAKERALKTGDYGYGITEYVIAKHITPEGDFMATKLIPLDNLTPTNFSHIYPKGMNPELRLEPSNIEIVSRAYHEWQHTLQIAQVNYIN